MKLQRSLAVFLSLSSAAFSAEPDWPQFRGPELNPVARNRALLDEWSRTTNVEWVTNVPGRGWSSPIVTGGKVFLTAAVTEGRSKPPQIGTAYSTDYHNELKRQGLRPQRLILAGVATNSVVEHTARHAVDMGYAVALAADACSAAHPHLHHAAIENIALLGEVSTVAALLEGDA